MYVLISKILETLKRYIGQRETYKLYHLPSKSLLYRKTTIIFIFYILIIIMRTVTLLISEQNKKFKLEYLMNKALDRNSIKEFVLHF